MTSTTGAFGPLVERGASSLPTRRPRGERLRRLALWITAGGLLLLAIAALVPTARRPIEFLLYAIPSNSILPLPHEPGLLYFSQLAPPLALAAAGALGAGMAALLDQAFIGWAFRGRRGAKLRDAKSWQWMTRLLLKAPAITVALVSFTGFPPIQAVRLVVLASGGVSARRYAIATAVGRFPRFYLIALAGRALAPPTWLVGAVTLAFLAWPLALLLRRPPAGPAIEEGPC